MNRRAQCAEAISKPLLVSSCRGESQRNVSLARTTARAFEDGEIVGNLAAGIMRLDHLVDPAALGSQPHRHELVSIALAELSRAHFAIGGVLELVAKQNLDRAFCAHDGDL